MKIFKNSRIRSIARYGEAGREHHGRPPGSIMLVEFDLDYCWRKPGAGGDPAAQFCGWLKDKFGLSWQIVPDVVPKLMGDHRSKKSQRAVAEMMRQKKPDIAALQKAYDG